MKATGKIIGRLIVGCVFVCCLTSSVYNHTTQGALLCASGSQVCIGASPALVP
jgi:hypothetical protein